MFVSLVFWMGFAESLFWLDTFLIRETARRSMVCWVVYINDVSFIEAILACLLLWLEQS